MSFATTATAIRTRFVAEWGSTTPISAAGFSFDPSKVDGVPENAVAEDPYPWVRLTIQPSTESQKGVAITGSRTFRQTGRVVVQVFTSENEGDAENQTLCEQVVAIFRGVTAGGIRYAGQKGESPRIRFVGNDGAGFFQQNVEIPYSADALH